MTTSLPVPSFTVAPPPLVVDLSPGGALAKEIAAAGWQPIAAPPPPPAGTKLAWAPPAGWQTFQPISCPTSGRITLNDATDYRLVVPFAGTAGCLTVVGGRHVVVVREGGALGAVLSVNSPSDPNHDNAALYIVDGSGPPDARIFHLEGAKLTGPYLGDGIQASAPKTILQVENCHVDVQHGDDKNASGSSLHTDAIQPWGGIKELRVDGLTTAGTAMQGVLLKNDVGGVNGDCRLRRVNFRDRGTYPGGSNIIVNLASQDTRGRYVLLDDGTVWMAPNPAGGLARQCYPYPPTLVIAGDGKSASWPGWQSRTVSGLVVQNWAKSAPGKVWLGVPPGGDYVPAASVGNAYVSPGYAA